jgi:hypothetical protein
MMRKVKPITRKIVISRDIRFDEYNFDLKIASPTEALTEGFHFEQEDSIPQVMMPIMSMSLPQIPEFPAIKEGPLVSPLLSPVLHQPPALLQTLVQVPNSPIIPQLRRSQRIRKQSVKLGDYHIYVSCNNLDLCFLTTAEEFQEPRIELENENITLDQVLADPGWRQALADEMESIYANNTWKLESPPPGVCPINY